MKLRMIQLEILSTACATAVAVVVAGPVFAGELTAGPPVGCNELDPTCTVVVIAPGHSGNPGNVGSSDGSTPTRGSEPQDPCTVDPNSQACSDERFQQTCRAVAATYVQTKGGWANVNLVDLNSYLATLGASTPCPAVAAPPAAAPPSPAVLAAEALKTLRIPSPVPGRYPAGVLHDGRPFTIVSGFTWFFTSPTSFRPLSASASAGGVSAQVTVTPSALLFTPGDGNGAVSCAGPGVAWQQGDGVWAPSPVGCDYRYPRSSIYDAGGEVTATYGIRWDVTWTSSTGTTGTLPAITTTKNSTFAVAEVEAVVTQ